MKCVYCDLDAVMHLELEPSKTLDLCEYHWQKLKTLLSEPSKPQPTGPVRYFRVYPVYPTQINQRPMWVIE